MIDGPAAPDDGPVAARLPLAGPVGGIPVPVDGGESCPWRARFLY